MEKLESNDGKNKIERESEGEFVFLHLIDTYTPPESATDDAASIFGVPLMGMPSLVFAISCSPSTLAHDKTPS